MLKNLVHLAIFFVVTPITLATSLFTLVILSNQPKSSTQAIAIEQLNTISAPRYGTQVFGALPDPLGKVGGAAVAADAREEILRQYLIKWHSPLEPYTAELVDISEKYDLDFRLLTAIAQQESNLCKKIPEGGHNCWGWGIHSKGTLGFDSYPEAIETVAKGIREQYIDKGFVTPEEIMSKYTPSSPGSWAYGVNKFLGQME
ncbi:MAG: hypothetical protein Q7S79_00580 [bacterium]|nr:hypothetical protein [bacterium]